MSKVFGLATMSVFGRMPSRDDDRIALIGVLSLTWLTLVAGAAWPAFAELFIPFVEDEQFARIAALALAVITPPAIGIVTATMHNNRGGGAKQAMGYVVSGYVYATVIGLTVVGIVVTVPLLKASYLLRRFTVARVMVMIPAGEYERAVEQVRSILSDAGVDHSEEELNPVIRHQFRLLGWILARVFNRDVADEMRVLRGEHEGEWFEVTVHAADISIIGRRRVVHLVRSSLVEVLGDDIVYLTWDDESQELENDARELREFLKEGDAVERNRVDDLVARLARIQLDQEPWDAMRRLLYRLERDNERVRSERSEQAEVP